MWLPSKQTEPPAVGSDDAPCTASRTMCWYSSALVWVKEQVCCVAFASEDCQATWKRTEAPMDRGISHATAVP